MLIYILNEKWNVTKHFLIGTHFLSVYYKYKNILEGNMVKYP